MPEERKITELEGTVLGLIGVKGPCTPYVVRKEFQQSTTPFWNGSTGTIYPLIERLSRQKLIEDVASITDGRGSKLYALTAKGKDILKKWLYQPTASPIIGTPPDPLRNRIEFLGFLTPEQRKTFLKEVKAGLEVQLQNVIKESKEHDQSDYFEYLSIQGGVIAARARLEWIVEISEILDK